jgi:uncharacterized protein (UPF0297 family)
VHAAAETGAAEVGKEMADGTDLELAVDIATTALSARWTPGAVVVDALFGSLVSETADYTIEGYEARNGVRWWERMQIPEESVRTPSDATATPPSACSQEPKPVGCGEGR